MSKEKINKSKVYTSLLFLCWFTIISCNLLKIFGYKEFEIPIFDFEIEQWIRIIINSLLFIINGICFTLILVKRKLNFKELLLTIVLNIINYIITFNMKSPYYIICDLLTYYLISIIITKNKWFQNLFECITILIIFTIYQLLTMGTKNLNPEIIDNNFIINLILEIDYYILILITILKEFKKGDFIYGRWKTILVILSKQKCFEKNVRQNQQVVEEVENELAYKIFIVILSISQFAIVGTACYFVNQVIIEFFIVFISFVFMRAAFGKSYHCDSVIKCTSLAIATFVIATRISLPLWASTFCNVLIGCLVAYMMYVMYYYIKYTKRGITLKLGMNKDDLLNLCSEAGLSETNINRMILRYVERKSIKEIASIEFVDDYTITQSLYRSRKKIKNI